MSLMRRLILSISLVLYAISFAGMTFPANAFIDYEAYRLPDGSLPILCEHADGSLGHNHADCPGCAIKIVPSVARGDLSKAIVFPASLVVLAKPQVADLVASTKPLGSRAPPLS
ncbi:MAG: hypothetical protein AAGE61_12665 [Pseudomonadota bacterium]